MLQTQSKGASNKIRLGNQSSSQGSTESSSASGLSRGIFNFNFKLKNVIVWGALFYKMSNFNRNNYFTPIVYL